MKKKFNLSVEVVIDSEDESEFATVLNNINILANMIEDLSLCTDGTEATLVSIKSDVLEKREKRGRPKKLAAVT